MPILRRVVSRTLSASLAAGALVAASAAWSADPLPRGGAGGVDAALEADLLEGLGDLKLPPPQQAAPAPGAAPSPASPAETAPPVDTPSVEELRGLLQPEGEDLGAAGESPTQRIGEMMRTVEERFVSKDSSQTTQQIQEDIVTQLRAMLEQQEKKCSQCSGGQCDSPGSSSSPGSKPGGSKPGQSKPKPGSPGEQGEEPGNPKQPPEGQSDSPTNPGDAADPQASSAPGATDSEDRLDPSRLEEVLRRSAADFDELWGQLPPQVQQRLKQGLTERTLPQYEPMIEAYYRRLAEDSGEAR
ncbi:MAG TPA: hypothetical protein VGN57_21035 [Pirellulaceae bacterium]|jgi:hypothetical protein|nr:hypothetical protein [Pirellulaceae bacterium]